MADEAFENGVVLKFMKTKEIVALTVSLALVIVLLFVKVDYAHQSCGETFRVSYGACVLPGDPSLNELFKTKLLRKDFLSGGEFVDFYKEGFEWSPRLNFYSGNLGVSQDFPRRLSSNQASIIRERINEVLLELLIREGRDSDVTTLQELINLEKAERSSLDVERKTEEP